ncbi:nuclease-related domain-containing protein [Thiococcus pfennigii]|uniref:nuclease-related domain-containing protein n=1 Tax=Thiococcus pfennigii TaxID=1057 RepID=UPI001908D7F2|nr:nuclease-related domain-containing protein [Thiococcus pfennigii]MBK1700995.1 hypothetical protein [Thiococcus pfennigii]
MEVAIFLVMLLAIGFCFGKRRKEREENLGEAAVRRLLVKYCRQSSSHILNNITLKFADGTTQIDHILITANGVLVIETKHYKGWIFADSRSRKWTQVIYRVKHSFQNPIHQNLKHIHAVRKLLDFLPKENIQGVVVFTGDANFKTAIPTGVIKYDQLQDYISNLRFGSLSENRIQFCVGRIECQRLEVTGMTDVEHQRFLERKFGVVN